MRNNKYKWIGRLLSCVILFAGVWTTDLNAQCIIGTGTLTTNGSAIDPVEKYYNYEHFQVVYTAAELAAGGMNAGSTITGMGFSISESAGSLASFEIRMGHTLQASASPGITPTSLTIVRAAATYAPVVQLAGSFDMMTFSTPFVWDGTSNIIVNTCTGSNPFASPYGGLRYTVGTACGYIRTDGSSNCATTPTATITNRPNVRFDFNPNYCVPGISVQDEHFTNVTFGSINNPSTYTTGYSDFYSSTNTNCTTGVSYPISAVISPFYGGDNVGVWIDFNHNGIFDASELTIMTSAASSSGTIAIPAGAVPGPARMRIRVEYFGPYDPCSFQTYGEVEDYKVTLVANTGCTGTPAASTTVGPAGACTGINFTLSLGTTYSLAGITYQWQRADDAGFTTNLTNLGTASTQVTNQTSAKYYRCQVTCTNSGLSIFSTTLQVTMLSGPACLTYCASGATTTADEEIYSVTVNGSSTPGTWNGAAGCGVAAPGPGSIAQRYSNFVTLGSLTSVQQLQTVSFTITENECDGATYYAFGTSIWIDFNQNGSLTDAGEQVFLESTTAYGPRNVTGSFQVPIGALTGQTLMRITVAEGYAGASLTPCLSYGYGETEDWVITITAAPPCSGVPNPGNTLSSANPACPSTAFTLSLQNFTTGTGVSYQWESSPNGSSWSNAAGTSTNATYVATQTSATYYRCQVTCSGNTTPSNALQVTMNNFLNCYCTPTHTYGTSGCYYGVINNVTLNTMNHNPACLSTTPYYFDNPAVGSATTTLVAGTTYSLSITSGNYNAVGVWIDFNQSGSFDATEYFNISPNNNSSGVAWTGTASVLVPIAAIAGPTKMRINTEYYCCYTTMSSTAACAAFSYGETEDYTVTIAIPGVCSGAPAGSTTLSSTPSPVCSGFNFTLSLGTGYTDAGIVYQWQSADDAAFSTNLANLGTSYSQIGNQSSDKYYRCIVTCTNSGMSTNSSTLFLATTVDCSCGTYCASASTTTADEEIYSITVNGSSTPAAYANLNGCSTPAPGPGSFLSRYSNFRSLGSLTSVVQGQSVAFSVDENECDGATYYYCGIAIWIDFNHNGSFTDAGEQVFVESSTAPGPRTASGTFNIPIGALTGPATMRIIAAEGYSGVSLTPCLSYGYGETEDWCINIIAATPCSGTPTPGNTISSAATACSADNITLSLQNNPLVTGLTYQWQSSVVSSSGPWTNFGLNANSVIANQSAVSWYQCVVTCSNGGASATSNPVQVGMSPCYCTTPLYSYNSIYNMCSYFNYIGNVTFAGINQSSTCANISPYYTYYGSQTATVDQTGVYPITISATAGGASFQLYKVYIDYNDNGSFDDAGELVYTSGFISSSSNYTTGSVTIPLSAPTGLHRLRVRSTNPLNVFYDANSCSDDGYLGETEDYNIIVNVAPPCSGTPTPGLTLASTPLACSSTSINLSVQNGTGGLGVTYQWQSSPNISFSSPTNLGTATTQIATQSSSTYYRCLVTCSGNTGTSTPVLVSSSTPCYCTNPVTGSDGCGLGLYINNFTFNGITGFNNTSGCWTNTPYTTPFYSYFPNLTASAMQNQAYTFSLSTPVNFSSYYQSWYIWIDFNDNGSFDDAGELVYSLELSNTSMNTASGSITIPLLANPGTHIMRIRSGNNTSSINSCSGNSVSGETEDYNITIVPLPPCSGSPNPGLTLTTDDYVCPNQLFTVSIENQPTASGYTYYWEWSDDNMATWEPIPGSTATPSTTISQTELWIIRCQVTCTASGITVTSTPVTVYMNSFFDCYCSPVMTSYDGTDYISNVTLNTINNTTGSTPLPGYANYGSIVTDLIIGLPYDVYVTDGSYSSAEHISAWIDFDQSGSFDPSEQIISPEGVSTYAFQTFSDNFVVPPTAMPGITRMRVADHFAATADPCPTSSYGEVEDYGINIIPPNITTNSPVCEGKTITLQAPTLGTGYLWSGPNGFTSTAYNPTIVLADPSDGGTYTVVVTTVSGSYTADGIVVVNPAPSLSASGPSAFCEGTQDLNLTSTAPTAITWNWTGPGGYTSSDEDPTRTNTDASMTGSYKIVVTDGNGCKDSSTIPVTIYELPTIVLVPAVSPAHVCTGSSISLYAEHWGPGGFDIGGATYVWSTTETGSPIQISAGGTYTVTGTDGNGCINVDNVTVTESAPPAAPIIVALGDVNLCSSDDGINWSTVVLHTTNYSTDLFWSTFNDFTQDITAYYPDNYFVIYTDPTFGCTSQSNIISVTGNYASTDPLNSQVSSNAPSNITCATPITLTLAEELNPNNRLAPAYLGTNAVWKWYLDGGSCGAGTLVGTGATINVTPPAAPGPHTYSVRAEGLCNTTNCANIVITVKDPSIAPTGATASVSTLCAGDQTQLSVVGGTLGTGAQWKWYAGTCGGAPIGSGPTVIVNTPVTTTYYVRAEGDCNTTLCQSTTVTVSTPSTDPTSASSNAPVNGICLGGSVTLTVSGGTLGTASSYKWYEDGCGTGGVVGTGASITITPAIDGLHSYYVRAEGPCNTTNCVGVQVLVGTYSVEASGITSSVAGNSICTGNNITLTLDGGFLGTVAQWKWFSGSCGGPAAGTGTSITVNPAVTTTYFVRAEGSCNNTNCASITVNVSSVAPVSPPPTITTAPNGICSGNGSTVACQAVTGATFYSWSAPNGTTFDGNNPSPYITTSNTVQVTFGNLPNGVSGYDICVFAGNGCGNTVTKCRYIRGRVQGAQTITGNASSCPNTTSAYSIVSLPGADSYTWTVTGAATINGGGTTLTTASTTVNVNFLAGWTSGTLTVYGSMNCGYNGPAKTITIISTPVVPGVITGPALVCPLQTYNFSIAPVAGASAYNWSTNVPGAVIGAGTTSRNITFPAVIPAGSTVSVTATGSCGTSLPRVKNIATGLANAPGTITGPATGQCGATTGYSILPVAGATSYLWTADNGATIFGLNNITTASVVFPVNGNTTTVSVVAINGCGNSAPQTKAVIGAPASPGVIAGPGAVCVGIQTYTYSVVGSVGATSYQWSSPINSMIMTGQNTNSVSILFTDNTSGNVTVYAQNLCGVSSTSSIAVSTVCRQAQIIQGSLIDAILYPNPTIGTTTLRFETITAGDYKVSVVDMTGQIMQTSTVTAVVGVNMHELDMSTYAKGLYMVRLEREGEAMQMLRVTVE